MADRGMAYASYNSREVNFYRTPKELNRYGSEESGSGLDEVPLMMGGTDGFETDENDLLIARHAARRQRQTLCGGCCDCFKDCSSRCCEGCTCCRKKEPKPRTVWLGKGPEVNQKFTPNMIKNQKYNIITFIPLVLFEQFKFFLNLYFLVMASSQFIPDIRVGYLYTYWGPLLFVIGVTMIREAVDDFRRYRRDKDVNSQTFRKLTPHGPVRVESANIKVGDIISVEKNQRVPADMVFLRTTERMGACFIRTDQLDGETDWKLRLAVQATQKLENDADLFKISAQVYAEKPQKDIYSFIGTFTQTDGEGSEDSLSLENTLWANTVVASGTASGVVVYTGTETRSAMNTSQPKLKMGLIDMEINTFTKILFIMMAMLSLIMMLLKGFDGPWFKYMFRFIILFSYIIPISLRVNLDMGKIWYSWRMQRDKKIPGTAVRTTTIPEELGRIQYLLSDKTGTLTQNEMVFKRLHLGTVSYGSETMDEVTMLLKQAFTLQAESGKGTSAGTPSRSRALKRSGVTRTLEAVRAIALCHNVTPVYNDGDEDDEEGETEIDVSAPLQVSYQASSPDEVALVKWTESVGLALVRRDLASMSLRTPTGHLLRYTILQVFPFTSETKRMGIIVKEEDTGEIMFYMKGADTVMQTIVQYNDWLDEECGNMAREGLRTLVVAKKTLTEEQYHDFESRYHQAKMSVQERQAKVAAVVESLERDMELLCLTGVEDKLQEGVRPTLELLRNAGIKIWMLTGDKLETATCIAKSSLIVARNQDLHEFRPVSTRAEAHLELNAFRRKSDAALVIKGDSLEVCLKYYEHEFVELACQCPAVVVCRCSPTQKAEIVKLLKTHTKKRTCAIGDGGNDVSMIQTADCGVGIVGKEGMQASLAADFSITQFSFIARLLFVHGRNSYRGTASLAQFIIHRGLIIAYMNAMFSAVFYFSSISMFPGILVIGYKATSSLAQFVIHRGMIISTMQAVFSATFYFSSLALFPGFLYIGYSTVYTNFPVFSLVLDKDVSSEISMTYPELYKQLTKGRSLNYKTFFMWVLISVYQGGIIMVGAFLLFEDDFIHIVSITFTSLLLTELLMIALTIRMWHPLMVVAELLSLAIYVLSLFVFKQYFDTKFLTSWGFIWKVIVITSISCIPLYVLKYLQRKFSPPSYSKLT